MKQELRSAFNTRQYMLARDFEIYYYSDVHFRTVAPHEHDYYEFYILIEGDASIEIGNERIPLKKGSLVLIPPHVCHRSVVEDSDTPYRRFVFWVSTDYAAKLLQESPDYGYLMQQAASGKRYIFTFTTGDYNLILSRAIRLLEEVRGNRYGRNSAITLCVNDFILTMNRSVYEEEHSEAGNDEDLFQKLTSYIEANLSDRLSLEDLSEKFFVSKYYIAHYFRKTLGITVHQYIMKKRLDGCRSAILSGDSITSTYNAFGFSDYSVFYRAFKKEYGMSPKEYQEVHGSPESDSGSAPQVQKEP